MSMAEAAIELQPPNTIRGVWAALAVAAVALALGPLAGMPNFVQALVIEILIFSILALSLDILLGHTGLVSFGHAAFFGVAAYGLGIAAGRMTPELMVTVPVGLAAAVLLAIPLGWLSIRLSGFYFLMITFAFAQMVYVVAFRWKWLTGGSDGLLIPSATFLGLPALRSRETLYYTTLAAFLLSCIGMISILRTQFGRALAGIRENTLRMRALGYNVRRYKLIAFVIAAGFGGIAGVLNSQFNLFIAPESVHWTQSALVLVMVLIGGSGYFLGPIIGATIVILLQHWLSSYTEYWGLVLGLLFIALISGAREGIAGIGRQLWSRLGGRQ
jgi:branched-chain amino acid transport system permease protein